MKDKNCTYSGVSIEDMPPERKELGKYIIKLQVSKSSIGLIESDGTGTR